MSLRNSIAYLFLDGRGPNNIDVEAVKLFDPEDKDFRKNFPESWLFTTLTIGK